MKTPDSRRTVPLSVIAVASVLALTTGSAIAWWGWTSIQNVPTPTASTPIQSVQPSQSEPQTPAKPIAPAPIAAAPEAQPLESQPRAIESEKSPQVYWLKSSGSQIKLVPSPVDAGSTAAPLKDSLTQLLAGTNNAALTTTIPKATKLRSVAVREDGIHVDLSQSFQTGGGTTSMTARVAQVLYTATSIDPNASVWLSVEGKSLESLGGEGLLLEQPMTRKRFEQDFSL